MAEGPRHTGQIHTVALGHVGVQEGTNPCIARPRVGLDPGNTRIRELFLGKGVFCARDRGFLFFSHVISAFGFGSSL